MENASKALLIAAEVLIAIIIIAVGIRLISSYKSNSLTSEKLMTEREVVKFNSRFLKYIEEINGQKCITAQNLITIARLADEIEKKDEIDIKVGISGNYNYNLINSNFFTPDANTDSMYKNQNIEGQDKTKIVYYKINEISYTDSTGRIDKIDIGATKYYCENDGHGNKNLRPLS